MVTSGGILGKVVSSAPDAVTVEIAQNCKVRVQWEHVQPAPIKKKESTDDATKKVEKDKK